MKYFMNLSIDFIENEIGRENVLSDNQLYLCGRHVPENWNEIKAAYLEVKNNPNKYKIAKKEETFYLMMNGNWFEKGDIIDIGNNYYQAKVLETPHKKWYKQLFQFITFGWYKAPTQYKCKIIPNG